MSRDNKEIIKFLIQLAILTVAALTYNYLIQWDY